MTRVDRLTMTTALLLIAVTFTAASAEMRQVNSRFYQITTDVELSLARDIGRHMDIVYTEYMRRFAAFRPKHPGKHPLYVFTKQADYQAMLAGAGIDGTGSGGMFFVSGRRSGLATYLEDQTLGRMFQTLRHEGFHQFAHSRIGHNLPPWANEGIAEYFGEAIVTGRKLDTGRVAPQRLQRVVEHVKADQHMPFDQLLPMSHDQWNMRVQFGQSSIQYDQSWSIVHFLVQGDRRYRAAFNNYLQMVARGLSSDQAMQQAFGTENYDNFEQAWRQYILELKPDPVLTAAHRLEFIAAGLKLMHQRGRPVDSLDQLHQSLARVNFRITQQLSPGLMIEISARDPENFTAPGDATIELTAPESSDTPHGAIVKGLDLPVKLTWRRDAGDSLNSFIEYP